MRITRPLCPVFSLLVLVMGACASAQPSAHVVRSSPSPPSPVASDRTPTAAVPLLSATSLPPATSSPPGRWQTYAHTTYGFSFCYPPDWTVEEKPDVPNFVWLKYQPRPTLALSIGFRRSTEEAPIQRTGVGAGELIGKGTVLFLGRELSRDVLVYQGKEKAVLYSYGLEIAVDDLIFTLSLDDHSPDYESVVIEQDIQAQVDEIVESFELTP